MQRETLNSTGVSFHCADEVASNVGGVGVGVTSCRVGANDQQFADTCAGYT